MQKKKKWWPEKKCGNETLANKNNGWSKRCITIIQKKHKNLGVSAKAKLTALTVGN